MSNEVFDQRIINPRERPLSDDLNGEASQEMRTLRELLRYAFARRASDGVLTNTPANGFLGDGYLVSALGVPGMFVNVRAGYGFQDNLADVASDINGALGTNDHSAYKPLVLTQTESLAVPSADPTNPRIDIVEVKYDRHLADLLSRDVLNTGTGEFVATLVQKTLAWNQSGRVSLNGAAGINYKTGTPAAVPVAPATSSGYIKIAEVRVGAAVTSITANKVNDTRPLLFTNGAAGRVSGRINLAMTGSPPVVFLDYLNAPPGVSVVVIPAYAGAGNTRYATVYVVGGDMRKVSARAVATASGFTLSDSNMITCEVGSGVFVIDASAQTALAAATVPAALAAAVGQRCVYAVLSPKQYDGATVAQPVAGALDIDFSIDFQTS